MASDCNFQTLGTFSKKKLQPLLHVCLVYILAEKCSYHYLFSKYIKSIKTIQYQVVIFYKHHKILKVWVWHCGAEG